MDKRRILIQIDPAEGDQFALMQNGDYTGVIRVPETETKPVLQLSLEVNTATALFVTMARLRTQGMI